MVYPQEVKIEGEIPLMPTVGKAVEEANRICTKCESGLFIIEENMCPQCEKAEFEKEVGKAYIKDEGNRIVSAISFKECKNCHIKLIVSERP